MWLFVLSTQSWSVRWKRGDRMKAFTFTRDFQNHLQKLSSIPSCLRKCFRGWLDQRMFSRNIDSLKWCLWAWHSRPLFKRCWNLGVGFLVYHLISHRLDGKEQLEGTLKLILKKREATRYLYTEAHYNVRQKKSTTLNVVWRVHDSRCLSEKKREKYYWKIETCDRCVWGHFIPRGWTATLVIAIYTRQYNTGSSQEERKRFHVIVRLQQSPLMHSVLIHNKVVSLGGVISSGNCARPQSCSISATKWRQSYDGYGGEIVEQKLIWSQRGLL